MAEPLPPQRDARSGSASTSSRCMPRIGEIMYPPQYRRADPKRWPGAALAHKLG
jgi:hypothetical protein